MQKLEDLTPEEMAVTNHRDSTKPNTMIVKFRARDYTAEAKAHFLPRIPTDLHPFSSTSSLSTKVDGVDEEENGPLDPLRAPSGRIVVPSKDNKGSLDAFKSDISDSNSVELLRREWTTFKRFLVQKFPPSRTVAISSIADLVIGSQKAYEKSSSVHLDELDDSQGSVDEDVKFITEHEYTARLTEMKNEILCAWAAGNHFKSLKLSVKVARLLRDTALLQFYPTLFTLATDILDMLGDMVWERIKRKVEYLEDGAKIRELREDFQVSDICSDAKDICHNWFCKIGSIRDLLPRIYLELAILPCWRFLVDDSADVIQRLIAMMRGLGNPLASAYCHLYLVYCVQKLPLHDNGYLVTCIRDINLMMTPIISLKETTDNRNNMSNQVLVHLMEPPMEYIIKCIFKDHQQGCTIRVGLGLARNLSELFGKCSSVSLVLHHLLKELPPEIVRSNVLHILDLIECSIGSSFDQCMNFRLLGFRLYETEAPMEMVNVVLERVIKDASQYQDLDAYLKVVDGYVDIVLQNHMKTQLEVLLGGIAERACSKWINDIELDSLQSVLTKILSHTKCLEDVLELNLFAEIIDVMRGTAKNAINMRILEMATRNGYIRCPTTIQFLLEVGQSLHDGKSSSNMLDSDNQPLDRLLSRFVDMVEYGTEWERHLAFLIECRATFASADEVKETLVHHANCLVMKASKASKQLVSFGRSCLAFSEATIPSIAAPIKQLHLYLETAEVALASGLVCHSDGLIESAIRTLQSLIAEDSPTLLDVDRIVCVIQKLCGLLIMVPGNSMLGVTYIPKNLLSLVNNHSLVMPARLSVRTSCANILLLAAWSQHKLPYTPGGIKEMQVPGNDLLFFDDSSYHEELASFCGRILQNVVLAIKQETCPNARGNLALEACNCIASVIKVDDNISRICNELVEMATPCLNTNHSYFFSTSKFLVNQFRTCNNKLSLA
ncbi:hypothetical protein BVRB_000520 isoform C [Beta vulgaris subsp. vulgaris]|uniref:Uncharacterized protein n=1 Tax=Beta vulgaris subsp. vulgaris TaxID=3555 RepID=A0A0J8B4V5_BETVV|nr:uncharacterized protein LOC104883378 isoform X3 [Beta vulgaris subsp. vulgaris]KMS96244.1 hypothetical protein BVRB_000520 isoform C [Beta vulgaris subsp. vulgaris]